VELFTAGRHLRLLPHHLQRTVALFLTALAASCFASAETPIAADSIADSVGINVHLHYTDTPYANFSLVQSLLTDLRVRHIRDGLVDTTWDEFYKRHNALGKLGIHCVYVTSPKQSETLLAAYPGRVRSDFEGYEAPNEYNNSGDPQWPETLKTFQSPLYRITKNNPSLAGSAIVIGPSVTQPDAFPKLSGLQQFFDYSNLHNYLAGRNPGTPGWGGGGYGSIKWNIDLAQSAWDGKPIMSTEIGYNTDPANKQGVPEDVEGKYMPRLILEQLLHHIRRTYIYELVDVGTKVNANEAAFGLVHNDGSKKPAYVALKNLIGLTIDRGSSPALGDLSFQLSGDTSNVHHLLARRGDGSYLLFVWIEERSFDPDSHKLESVAAKTVNFISSAHFRSVQLISFSPTGDTTTRDLKSAASIPLSITDALSVVKLVPSGAR
jgi:hypothetical protein